jgi:hypothetical protein
MKRTRSAFPRSRPTPGLSATPGLPRQVYRRHSERGGFDEHGRFAAQSVYLAVAVVVLVGVLPLYARARSTIDSAAFTASPRLSTTSSSGCSSMTRSTRIPRFNDARKRVPKAGLKFHVTALVCEVTGGPCKFSGRSMKEAHEHLNINEGAVAGDGRRFPQDPRKVQGSVEGAGRADCNRGKHEEGYCEGVAQRGTVAPPTCR